jgi:hypothetical protein
MLLAEIGGLSKSIMMIFMFTNLILSYKSFMIEILSELFLVRANSLEEREDREIAEKKELNDLKTIIDTRKVNES